MDITAIQCQFFCNLVVGQVQPHEIETQDPHFQGLMMAGKDGVSQIIKAFVTVVTLIALTIWFRVIKATLDDMLRLTNGALDTVWPT
jgi:hypothetical protein